MEIDKAIVDLITQKPEFLLMVLTIAVMPILTIPMLLTKRSLPGELRRQFVLEMMKNPAIESRLKDPQADLKEIMEQLLKFAASPPPTVPPEPAAQTMGFWAKLSHDITWDVAGIIGLIVTVVLMFMVVSRTYADMPREILAGWTTILGFYFGKATK